MKRKLDRSEPVQVVNVLDPMYYNLGSIRGSRKIPAAELLAAKGFKVRGQAQLKLLRIAAAVRRR